MEQIIIGGSHVPEENLRMINAIGYSTFCGFGMTEMAVTSAECRTDLENRLSGSVGWPMEISEYRIIPDGGDPMQGELWIRSEAMHMEGFEKRRRASAPGAQRRGLVRDRRRGAHGRQPAHLGGGPQSRTSSWASPARTYFPTK
jgi:hypothetical protein